ncbi:MAG: hypothetical protein WKF71_10910 [Pyrinomonadaceae bacterium]
MIHVPRYAPLMCPDGEGNAFRSCGGRKLRPIQTLFFILNVQIWTRKLPN